MRRSIRYALVAAIELTLLTGCSSNEVTGPEPESPETPPATSVVFQELYDQGVDRYLGVFSPTSSEVTAPGTIQHRFTGDDGPLCYTGNPFSMYTREGSGDDLLIFLQGGGFCAPGVCAAVPVGLPFIPMGILDPVDPTNPAATHDVGYVPYCDGCAMMGDAEVDSDGDGAVDRYFRGLKNLSASLDVIAREFPDPGRIVLAGNSAGGFAVHAALPLVRRLYPEVTIDVINDSGVGVLDPGGWATLSGYWNAGAFLPASCPECIGPDGNLTDYHAWQLGVDENVRMAYVSSTRDATISATLAGGGASLEAELLEAVAELSAAYPERFQSLIASGDEHTFILKDFDHQIGSTTVREWVAEMFGGGQGWASVSDSGR